MKYVGIDYSITSPSICVCKKKKLKFQSCQFYYLTSHKKLVGDFKNLHGTLHEDYLNYEERWDHISSWAMSVIPDDSIVTLEGYSYGSTGSRLFQIAENCAMLKYKLWVRNIPFEVVAPSAIKKFATGKGNANKQLMYESFLGDSKVDLVDALGLKKESDKPITDIVDSYYICKYGREAS
jgi:hypothetical protein